ncbi:MAG: DNA-processing protein DprA, partial [Deltaproteobacteria bacterium]|nr:DNA-processing protein DprA [Deltaproteobacteria bacterium]
GFAERDRIIAALSDILIAVQAPRSSGTLITAGWALSLSKPVFALPGDIWYENSAGTNSLFARGAVPLHEPAAILPFVPEGIRESLKRSFDEWFHQSSRMNVKPQGWDGERGEASLQENFSEFEMNVIELLKKDALHMDKLLNSFRGRDALFESLMRLEIKGIIRRLEGGFYALVKKV